MTDVLQFSSNKNSILAVLAAEIFDEFKSVEKLSDIKVVVSTHPHLNFNEILFVKDDLVKGFYVTQEFMPKLREDAKNHTFDKVNYINKKGENCLTGIMCPLYPKSKYIAEDMFPVGMTNGDLINVDNRIVAFSRKFADTLKMNIIPTCNNIESAVPQSIRNKSAFMSFNIVTDDEEGSYPTIQICLDEVPYKRTGKEESIELGRTPIDVQGELVASMGDKAARMLGGIVNTVQAFNRNSVEDIFIGCRFKCVLEYAKEAFTYAVTSQLLKMAKPLFVCSREGSQNELREEVDKILAMASKVTKNVPEDAVYTRLDVDAMLFWDRLQNGGTRRHPASDSKEITDYLTEFEGSFGRLLIAELARSDREVIGELITIEDRRPLQKGDQIGKASLSFVNAKEEVEEADDVEYALPVDNSFPRFEPKGPITD